MAIALFSVLSLNAQSDGIAVKSTPESHVNVHGFIRNYFAFDTRESVSGTGDLFYYVPKDQNLNSYGDDLNAQNQFRFLALTSRLWVDVNGYEIQNTKIGARIEADFYTGLDSKTSAGLTDRVSGTAQFRLRQAFVTLGWQQDENRKESLKIGQMWHPMAADMPDVISLNTGAPFGPFSRTPVAQFDMNVNKWFGFTTAGIWQQQYKSQGPAGASAIYMKYGCTPEVYMGLNFTPAKGLLVRTGFDVLSIKPRTTATDAHEVVVRVSDRITTSIPFFYLQYKTKVGETPFVFKAKTVFAEGGEHVSLNGGYGVSAIDTINYTWDYTPSRNSSSWISLSIGQKYQGVLFAGYVKNFGTKDELIDPIGSYYFSGNSFKNMNQMFRVTPTFLYNLGKFTFGLEYECTSIQYGSWDASTDAFKHGLATKDLHWITNHRIQAMVKFTF